jgi:hypothetical protein
MTPMIDTSGPWVEQWLSVPRFARYLDTAAGDRGLALELYEWNAVVSAAVLRDLGHLEIGLRNAYDRALSTAGPTDWTDPAGAPFVPLLRSRRRQRPADVNEPVRRQLADARQKAGSGATHGKVVAELMFGFWRYLSSAAHEKTLWVPYLHKAFPPGTRRRQDVDERVVALNRLRNRAAHHEHLLSDDLADRHDQLVALAGLLSPLLGRYVLETSQLPPLLASRPTLPRRDRLSGRGRWSRLRVSWPPEGRWEH